MVPQSAADVTSDGEQAAQEAAVEIAVEAADGTITATPDEAAALRRTRVVSNLLDEAVRVPGTDYCVGLDPLLGVISGYGDAVSAAISLYPILEALRLDAPKRTLAKMLALVATDFAIGSIPVVGTVFDAVWKANAWNVRALERHIDAS
ncbi:hypothetical protein L593_02020 [Salinarchaeum sp. Harcht-Bsk1]|uniref:DUF4112 domain-containing protein n=1 Tax=Salinarchaeum sp. Harcht-Bsk1 TaxID=1333523 RepID=UPI000342300B|nr:DUF4112 domain-containing protein [Salinarchaeum sp. Harcht-Bsk1]AGN00355.1 hypothetical protein L593_02020 [Salinarchaeum sp. Harcht-Bsk1]